MLRLLLFTISCCWMLSISAQADRWQQRIMYNMDIDFNVSDHTFEGKQRIVYINNSPDQLDKVFYHLYYNAFQPGSMMDVKSRTIEDPDRRVGSRIYSLDTKQMGFTKVNTLTQNGRDVAFKEEGTILEVTLNEPIPPNGAAVFEMEFLSQVPDQIRRTGKFSSEAIDLSLIHI